MPRPTIVPMPPRDSGASGPIPHTPQRFLSLDVTLDGAVIAERLLPASCHHHCLALPIELLHHMAAEVSSRPNSVSARRTSSGQTRRH
jgi:hypothetical protein